MDRLQHSAWQYVAEVLPPAELPMLAAHALVDGHDSPALRELAGLPRRSDETITDAPEQFLYAVARLVLGDEDTRAEFEGEPQVYRWFFHRDGTVVDVRLILADDAQVPDSSGTVLWSGRHTVTAFARSAVWAFDRIDYEQGEESYEAQWGRPFPPAELEALRTAMRAHRRATAAEDTAPEGVPMSGGLGRRPAVAAQQQPMTTNDDHQAHHLTTLAGKTHGRK